MYCTVPVDCDEGADVILLVQDRVCTYVPVDTVKSLWVPYNVLRSGGEGCKGFQLHKEIHFMKRHLTLIQKLTLKQFLNVSLTVTIH
jgi:hypothetical protein